MSSVMRDPEFQTKALAFICRDSKFLKDCGDLLDPDDFRKNKNEVNERYLVAKEALKFWHDYREPIASAGMLRTYVNDAIKELNLGEKTKVKVDRLLQDIQKREMLVAVDALRDKLIQFKKETLKDKAVKRLIQMQELGKLSDDKWYQICAEGVANFGNLGYVASDYFSKEEFEHRIIRRQMAERRKFPYLMIDPIDEEIRAIGRGDLGLLLALYKVGKSVGLTHLAYAYVFQGLNVLFITLEDPKEAVEDRFDAMLSGIPTKELINSSGKLRRRFRKFDKILRARLKVIDGTDGGMTVRRIEEIYERERNRGFSADVIIIDYDDEIVPPRPLTEYKGQRRHEFADIYRELRKLAARTRTILWTAAQAQRLKENTRVISGNNVAEDISKIRKCMMAIGIGQGEWGEHSRYLFIAAHKYDKSKFGFNIMGDFDRAMFYDRKATLKMMKVEAIKQKKKKKAEAA